MTAVLLAVVSLSLPSLRDAASLNAAYTDYSRARLSPAEAPPLSWLVHHTGLPLSRQALLLKARVALAAGDPAMAVTALGVSGSVGHDDVLTEFLLGQSYAAMHAMPDAIAHWRTAHAADYFLQLGLALRHRKDWNSAERALLTAAAIQPNNADTQALLAQFYRESGKPNHARPYLARIIELNVDPYQGLLARAELALLDDQPGQSANGFLEATRVQPSQPEAYSRLADVLVQLGRTREAVDALQTGIAQVPAPVSLYLRLGTLLSALRQYADADAAFAQATRLDPHTDESWLLRAQNALAAGDAPGADSYLRSALRLAPQNADSHFWLAVLRARQGDCAAANAALAAASALAPGELRYQSMPLSEPPC